MTSPWRRLEQERGLTPFAGEERSVQRLYRTQADPQVVVRAAILSDAPRWTSPEPHGKFSREDARIAPGLFGRLREFSINVLPFETEQHPIDSQVIALTTVPLVEGLTIAEALQGSVRPIPFDALCAYYDSLVRYYREVGKAGEPVLADLAREGRQAMFGRYRGGADTSLVLVDVDPIWTRYNPVGTDEDNRYYNTAIGYLIKEIDAVEAAYGKQVPARDLIGEVF